MPITDEPADVARIRSHLDAGADHVIVSTPRDGDFATGIDHLVRIAPQFS